MAERAVGLEHVVKHRVLVVKEVRWAWNWLVSEGTCQEHPYQGQRYKISVASVHVRVSRRCGDAVPRVG